MPRREIQRIRDRQHKHGNWLEGMRGLRDGDE